MGKPAPRKPPGAKDDSGLSASALKYGAWILGIAAVIGLSHVLSPKAEEDASDSAESGRRSAVAKMTAGQTAVMQLNDTTFDSFLAANPDGALVNFHSQSCQFCAKLAPEFEKAAVQLKASGGPPLVSLDSADAPQMMKRFGIDRYPTVYWFWHGQNTLEFPRAPEKPAEKIADWAKWAFQTAAVQDIESLADFNEALPLMRSTVHTQQRLFVAFNHTGFPGLRTELEAVAQRYKAKTVFLFIKDSTSEGPMLKAYAQDEASDVELASATSETLAPWVKNIVEEAKIKHLESQVEEKKAKNEPLEKTLEILQAAKQNTAPESDDSEAAKEDGA